MVTLANVTPPPFDPRDAARASGRTDPATDADRKPEAEDETEPPPDFFSYTGPKISVSGTLGASTKINLVGFQASTTLGQKHTLSFAGLAAYGNVGLAALTIVGARKIIRMDLSPAVHIWPGILVKKLTTWLQARGVQAVADGNGTEQTDVSTNAQAISIDTTGNSTDIAVNLNANHTTVES